MLGIRYIINILTLRVSLTLTFIDSESQNIYNNLFVKCYLLIRSIKILSNYLIINALKNVGNETELRRPVKFCYYDAPSVKCHFKY